MILFFDKNIGRFPEYLWVDADPNNPLSMGMIFENIGHNFYRLKYYQDRNRWIKFSLAKSQPYTYREIVTHHTDNVRLMTAQEFKDEWTLENI